MQMTTYKFNRNSNGILCQKSVSLLWNVLMEKLSNCVWSGFGKTIFFSYENLSCTTSQLKQILTENLKLSYWHFFMYFKNSKIVYFCTYLFHLQKSPISKSQFFVGNHISMHQITSKTVCIFWSKWMSSIYDNFFLLKIVDSRWENFMGHKILRGRIVVKRLTTSYKYPAIKFISAGRIAIYSK